jgi:hypothetical protein
MKYSIFFLGLFFCLHVNGQSSITANTSNATKFGLTAEELSYACAEYKKLIATDVYLDSEKKARDFAEKVQDFIVSENIPFDSIKDKTTALNLIKRNLKKTKFSTVAEAEKYIDEMESSNEKVEKENKLLFELLNKATVVQRHQIFQPLFARARSEIMH